MGPWLVDVRTRAELDRWLGGSPPVDYAPVLMLVRGDSTVVREFLPNALDAAKLDDRRVVVWIKDLALLRDAEASKFFGGEASALAAVLNGDGTLAMRVHSDRIEVDDADFAFSTSHG